jgi:hypothetical protein
MRKLYIGDKDVSSILKLDGGFVYVPFGPKVYQGKLDTWLDSTDVDSYPGSGSTWSDLVGSNNTTLVGNYEYIDNAIRFGGQNNSGSANLGTTLEHSGKFIAQTFFKIDAMDGTSTCLWGEDDETLAAQGKIAVNNDGQIRVRMRADGFSGPAVLINVGYDTGSMHGSWHMLTVIRDDNNWISASLDDGAYSTGSIQLTQPFTIDQFGSSGDHPQGLSGSLAAVLFYTSSNIEQSDLVGNWNYYNSIF